MARIGVTGARGQLGQALIRLGGVPIEADVTDHEALLRALEAVVPDVVIHCAALTDVDECEAIPMRAAEVNTGGTYHLALLFEGPIVYISTDYVFDGRLGPYFETDPPCPINVYGWSKLGGEIVLRNRDVFSDLIVRTTVLYSADGDNFVTKVIRQLQAGREVRLPNRMWGSPTYVPHLAAAIVAAVEGGVTGIINLAGLMVMSRQEFGRLIADEWGFDTNSIKPGAVNGDVHVLNGQYCAPRPLRAGLNVRRALNLELPVHTPLLGLRELHREMERMADRGSADDQQGRLG